MHHRFGFGSVLIVLNWLVAVATGLHAGNDLVQRYDWHPGVESVLPPALALAVGWVAFRMSQKVGRVVAGIEDELDENGRIVFKDSKGPVFP